MLAAETNLCSGLCKGPYTLTTVLDYNARCNVTLFFYQRNNDQNGVRTHDFLKAYGCCHGNSIFFFHNMVYITLIRPGVLLANKVGQGILREMHNIHVAIHLQEQKHDFWFKWLFFFSALALLPKCKSLTLPIRQLLSGLPKIN